MPKDKDLKKKVMREVAVQVAHAIATHRAQAEQDWHSAVDDLNKAEDTGAGHLGEHGFGSGIYSLYVCVITDLLIANLGGDRELAGKGLEALARALAEATSRGKQNSHGHHPKAYYIRAERGSRAPRDLSGAFCTPADRKPAALGANDLETGSVKVQEKALADIDNIYGPCCDAHEVLQVGQGGTLDEIAAFAAGSVA